MRLPIKEIIEWDVLNWSQLIEYWAPIIDTLPKDSKVLAIGERNGGLSAWLALKGFSVVYTDCELPTETAKATHRQLGIAHKIEYRKLDIVNCDWQSGQFDIIVAKSVIGGVKSDASNRMTRNFAVQKKAVENVFSLLKDNGYFFSAENMNGSMVTQQLRKLKAKGKGWRYLDWNELPELYGAFERNVQVKAFGLLPTVFKIELLNRLCFLANKYVFGFLPKRFKYISFVTAQKRLQDEQ